MKMIEQLVREMSEVRKGSWGIALPSSASWGIVAIARVCRALQLSRREAAKVKSPRCDALRRWRLPSGRSRLEPAPKTRRASRPRARWNGGTVESALALLAGPALPAEDSRASQTRA